MENKSITDIDLIEIDNQVKLEKWYNGRKLRHYLQLLELAETIVRSSNVDESSKTIARGFANHYRRMVMCIVMKPFNPEETDDYVRLEKIFACELKRLSSLLDRKPQEKSVDEP